LNIFFNFKIIMLHNPYRFLVINYKETVLPSWQNYCYNWQNSFSKQQVFWVIFNSGEFKI
jgi:hypothetical protein